MKKITSILIIILIVSLTQLYAAGKHITGTTTDTTFTIVYTFDNLYYQNAGILIHNTDASDTLCCKVRGYVSPASDEYSVLIDSVIIIPDDTKILEEIGTIYKRFKVETRVYTSGDTVSYSIDYSLTAQ